MICGKIRLLLSAYADDELSAGEESTVAEHLKACPGCLNELEHYRQLKKCFAYKEKVEPKPFFETRLFNRIETTGRPRTYFPAFRKFVPAFLMLAIIGLGVFAGKTYLSRGADENMVLTDSLFDPEEEEGFKEELIRLYYSQED